MQRLAGMTSGVTLVILLLAAACGGDDGAQAPATRGADKDQPSGSSFVVFASVTVLDPEEKPSASSLSIVPEEVVVSPGQTVILNAVAYDPTGQPVPGVGLQWRMLRSAAGAITDAGVFVAGTTPGTYSGAVQVTAAQQGDSVPQTLSAQADVIISSAREERVLSFVGVYPSQVTVKPRQFIGLGALGWDAQGQFIPGLTFEWSMEDSQAGSVDRFGFFTTGDDLGEYPNAIRVRAVQQSPQGLATRDGFVSVTIGTGAPRGVLNTVEIVPDSVFLESGEDVLFAARAFDGNSQPLRDVALEWRVDNPQAGSIDDRGKLKAGSDAGAYPQAVRVIATQTSQDGDVRVEDVANVIVTEPRPKGMIDSVHVLPSSVALDLGQRFVFTLAVFGQNESNLGDVSIDWAVTDPGAGSIDRFGVFTAGRQPGIYPDSVRIQVAQGEGAGRRVVEAYATIGIVGDLQRATIQPSHATVRPGQTIIFNIQGYDANGLRVTSLESAWSVEDQAAGTIDGTGRFTGGNVPGEYPNSIKVVVSGSGN